MTGIVINLSQHFLGGPKSKLSFVVVVLANNLPLLLFYKVITGAFKERSTEVTSILFPSSIWRTDEVVSLLGQTLGIV